MRYILGSVESRSRVRLATGASWGASVWSIRSGANGGERSAEGRRAVRRTGRPQGWSLWGHNGKLLGWRWRRFIPGKAWSSTLALPPGCVCACGLSGGRSPLHPRTTTGYLLPTLRFGPAAEVQSPLHGGGQWELSAHESHESHEWGRRPAFSVSFSCVRFFSSRLRRTFDPKAANTGCRFDMTYSL